jgi:hypothetical protein
MSLVLVLFHLNLGHSTISYFYNVLCFTPHAVFTEEINFGPVSSSDMFKIACAECVIAACVTLLAVVKLYNLHWELTGMYSLNHMGWLPTILLEPS